MQSRGASPRRPARRRRVHSGRRDERAGARPAAAAKLPTPESRAAGEFLLSVKPRHWAKRLHRAADRLDCALRPAIRHVPPVERGWIGLLDAIVGQQTDRHYLRRTILPAIRRAGPQRILFVGVRGYTRGYEAALARPGTEYWTTDIDPAAAPHGAAGRHVTADVTRIDSAFPPGHFDLVAMNGIFGWGVDDPPAMERAARAVASILAPGGFLLLGWNSDRSPDPETLPAIGELFEPGSLGWLPQRQEFADVTHVYAWYRRRPEAAGKA